METWRCLVCEHPACDHPLWQHRFRVWLDNMLDRILGDWR